MTVGTVTRFISYPGDGSANARAVPFKFISVDDLRVTRTNADGSTTVLTRGTHYSVTGADNDAGGSVTPLAAIAVGTSWLIEGAQSLDQPTNYPEGDDFPAASHERALDRAMIGLQEERRDRLAADVRSVKVPAGVTAPQLANPAGQAGKFPVVLADGSIGYSNGTGADAGLRGDLAGAAGHALFGFVLPIAKGGTGGASAASALANLGVANIGAEVAITGTVTIANSFPAAYVIRNSVSPADYVVNLPAAAAVGSVVFFRVDPTATKLFTLYDSGTLMDGIDRRILWAGESAMLVKTASGWTKIGGISIPMQGVLRRTASQSLTASGWNAVDFTEEVGNLKGLNFCLDATNKCFKAPRDGVWSFTATLPVSNINVGEETYGAFAVSDGGTAAGVPNAISVQTRGTGQSRNTHNISNQKYVTRTQAYGAAVFVGAGTPQLEYISGILEIAMTYQEVVTW